MPYWDWFAQNIPTDVTSQVVLDAGAIRKIKMENQGCFQLSLHSMHATGERWARFQRCGVVG